LKIILVLVFALVAALIWWCTFAAFRGFSDFQKLADGPLHKRVQGYLVYGGLALVISLIITSMVIFAASKELAALKYLFF